MSDSSKSLASSTLASASSLMALQLLSRLFTFAFNQALLRLASPKVFGTAAIQFELLLNTVLFLSRDGVRNALIRNWPRKESNSSIKEIKKDLKQHQRAVENIAHIPLMIGLPLAALVAFVYVRYLTGEEAGSQPHFVLAVSLYALAAVVELVSEPMHNR
jgi:oligosaccharide translocation protein RFT1